MSKGWAAIVYGRTYHLDFRFITVPQDFTPEDLNWASTHIIATTGQARNLAGSPRWSLFKNNSYCVAGVTCMIKDLIGHTVKDDWGRPLYAFVGYVTQLTPDKKIDRLPPYSDRLDNFKTLYQEIERVWSVRDYDSDSRKPALSQYYPIDFVKASNPSLLTTGLSTADNNANKIYLWSNNIEQNNQLWQASAQSLVPVATCLNIKGKPLTNSPFLNQSNHQIKQFQVLERVVSTGKYYPANTEEAEASKPNSTLSQITNRAREDIDITLQQAAKVAIAGQELLNNLADPNQSTEAVDNSTDNSEFGFKKISNRDCANAQPEDRDWF